MAKKLLLTADLPMSPESSRPERPSDLPSASGSAWVAAASTLPYETMFLASPLPASVSGLRDGRLIAVNDAWLAMAGCERDSVMGRTTVELGLWPAEAQRQAFVEQLGTAGESQQRYLMRLAGGLDHSVRIHSVKIEASPEPLLLAFIVEATREVEAQSARERSEASLLETNRALEQRLELHAALEKLAHVGYWAHNKNDQRLYWSPSMYEFTGFPTDRPLLRTEVRSYIHPEDLPAWLAAREACDFREVECRWLRPDGRVRWFRTRIGRTAVAGNPQTDFGVVQDITAEREIRERLDTQLNLLENITARVPGLVYRIQLWPDGHSEISYMNDRARDMLEAEPADLRRDARQFFLRVHPEDKKSVQRSLEQAAKSLTVWRQDYRVCLSGGRTRWYSVEAVPQAEADGSVVLHGFTTDVTEARLASQRLQRQHRMLDAVREAQALYIEIDDKRRTFEGLLAAFIRLTNSSYGFVGEVFHNEDGTPYLRTQAIANMAWDEPSRLFHESQLDAGMAFHNLRTLFGQAMVTGQPVIANDPRQDSLSGGVPAGHPPMDAFLCIPLTVGDRVVALVGLANQPDGYSPQDVEFLQPLLGTVRQLVLAWQGHAERQRTLGALERTSRQLADKSETLQATLDSISQGLTKIDANGRVLMYNQRLLALLDLSQAFMDAQPTHEEVVRFQRERGDFGADMELVEPKALAYLAQPGGTASPDKYWRKTSDGRTLEVRSRQLADGGMVRTFADVTSHIEVQEALQEERQRLAWVLEATRPGIWESNLDTGALRINERWAEMLGHTLQELEPIEQTTWRSRMHPEDLPRVRRLREKHLSGELPFYDCDLRLRHKDGHWVWINTQGRVHQRDAQGRPIFMSGIHLDISDRVAAQEEVLALNASLEQRVSDRTAALERSLRDMEAISYSIAHDLRAPLRSVNGFSSLIAEETDPPLSPVVSDMFARINNASRKM
ncbi:MAG: PAS domain S-box-containing protein, partial [Hydrogenophaga sp.]